MKLALINVGTIVTGDWRQPLAEADALLVADGAIERVGGVSAADLAACDVVIDVDGATVTPGFIDSHSHRITQRSK